MDFSVVRTPLVVVSAAFTFLLFLSERGLGAKYRARIVARARQGHGAAAATGFAAHRSAGKRKRLDVQSRVEQVEKSVKAVQSAPSALNPAITPIQPLVPELCQRNSSYFTALTSIHRWRPETKSTPVEASSQLRADSLNLTSLNS